LTETFTSGSENLLTEITYDNSKPSGVSDRVLSKIVKSGGSVIARQEYVYDSKHNLIKDIKYRTGSELSTITYGMYDDYGNPGLVTDANGNSMYYIYDNRIKMLPTMIIYMNSSYQERIYDYRNGKLLAESVLIGPNSQFQTNPMKVYQYDSYGRILSITYAGQTSPNELFAYDLSNNSVTKTIKDPSGLDVSSTVFYNSIGKPIKVISQAPGGKTVTSEKSFSINGRILTEIPDYISTTDQFPITYTYDENLQVKKIDIPAQKKTITFSFVGNTKTVTDSMQYIDPNGGGLKNSVATSTEIYSLSGKLLEKTVSGGSNASTTRYTYFPNGLKKTVSIGSGSKFLTTSYSYDMTGNNLSQTSPNTGTSTYTYYPNGVLHTKTDAREKQLPIPMTI
jgi:hypothetical protein